jgi:hypothetical protein
LPFRPLSSARSRLKIREWIEWLDGGHFLVHRDKRSSAISPCSAV